MVRHHFEDLGKPVSKTHILVDRTDTQVIAFTGFDGIKMLFHNRRAPTDVASFAMELLRVHAGITARDNGQDDAGRAKIRRDSPAEAVAYACETAALAFDEFKQRGWLIPVPSWEELEEKAKPQN